MKKLIYKCNFARLLLFIGAFLFFSTSWMMAQDFDTDVPIGWAVVPGNGVVTTTGGAGGDVVTATSASQLTSYVGSSQPLIIQVQGTISGSGMINVASNKTIIGQGSNAKLSGIGLSMNTVSNIIIRNLTITGVGVDGIATRNSHHVWIDHCDVSNCGDGAIDITIHSDYHTVSWVRLHNHDKTMLINSGTSQDDDIGTLNTTLHHCWWDGTIQRNPRVGYGKVHVLNCLYSGNSSYGIGLHSQCKVLAEKNYFDKVKNPISQMYRDDPADIHHGFCEEVDNIFDNCSGDRDEEGISFPVDDYYMYNFMVDAAANVPSIVKENAGPDAQYENIGLLPTPGQGAVKVSSSTLQWTKGQSATSYKVYFGSTTNPPLLAASTSTSYSAGSLAANTIYYWRVDQVTSEGTVEGKIWTFNTGTAIQTDYLLTTSTSGQGSVSPTGGSYNAGDVVTLTATPESGWQFSGWSGALTGTANPATLTMDGNKSVTATFTETSTEMYSLTASVNGQGSVSPSSGSYSPGSEVTLTATPSTGWHFVNWSGDATGTSSSITITMNSDKSLTANFEADETSGGCDDPVTISTPFSKDGAGEFCWQTTDDISYVNSWNLEKLEINGIDFTNTWSDEMPPKQDGYYNIHYVAEYSWAHCEIASTKSAEILGDSKEKSSELVLHCYPNPVDDKLNIQFSREINEIVDVYVMDVNGKVVLTDKANGLSHTLNMSGLPIGLYTVKVSVENQDVTVRVVKE